MARNRGGRVSGLVLSLFPGIGLLDRAFEEEGYTVVRGPDPLWGGDIRGFHPPGGVFAGVIGGPPCQAFSRLRRMFKHETPAENLIPEYERCTLEAAPSWFLMEMVPEGPEPVVPGYRVAAELVRDVWVGGATQRMRRFSFGTREGTPLNVETLALHEPDPLPAVTASGATWIPIRHGGSGKPKRTQRGRVAGLKTAKYFDQAKVAQGLPEDFDLPGFTVREKIRAIGNGVPLPMGRAVARAVREALNKTPSKAPGA